MNTQDIYPLISRWIPDPHARQQVRIYTDTTDFFNIEYNDVVILGKTPYLIRHNAKVEGFGLEDAKQWVKRAINLTTGTQTIIKLVFYEKFTAHIGDIAYEIFRSPRKEARILKLVTGHQNFMQGYSVEDDKQNVVRVIDFIRGKSLPEYIGAIHADHETYFHEQFPDILKKFMECIAGIRYLHQNGEKHGDIRRDHILIDREKDNTYRWIDFDYNYRYRENLYAYDLFGLGNILIFLTAKGDVVLHDLKRQNPLVLSTLYEDDLNMVFHHRVANLKKIYPYIPESLNRVLLHFSKGANWFYENTSQLSEDLDAAMNDL